MDQSRLKLQNVLEIIMKNDKVYFQPPDNILLTYPCIIYKRKQIRCNHANNDIYKLSDIYDLTLIHTDQDNKIQYDILMNLKYSSLLNIFVNDNLYHFNYEVYY